MNRPYATFDGKDLYPTVIHKACALFESLITNHPFIDGNKRTAYILFRMYLMEEGIDIYATLEEKYEFVILVSKGEMGIDDCIEWLRSHVIERQ